ncbi:MAG: hypothetical protein WCT40_04355 [Candidatus Magasanikbacteria bacterium]|jgi:uncharacterized membrane protein HdeD (DUF308 family)
MNKKIFIVLMIFTIIFGIFLFIFGGYDDSPGAQLLGLTAIITGIVLIIKYKKYDSKK